ncbi:hypothetical protein BMT74_23380, partial [Escherichia coli]
CSPMTSLKTSIKTITYLSDIGCLEIHGASLARIKIPEINVSFFGLNSAGFSDYPTINSDSDIGGLESCCE